MLARVIWCARAVESGPMWSRVLPLVLAGTRECGRACNHARMHAVPSEMLHATTQLVANACDDDCSTGVTHSQRILPVRQHRGGVCTSFVLRIEFPHITDEQINSAI